MMSVIGSSFLVMRLVAPALLLPALVLAGCSVLQESLECPGDNCPGELQAVADDAAAVGGVTSVDRTWRFYGLDRGNSGGVEVHADVADEQQAREIARELALLYAASDVSAVDYLSVIVVPDPERARADTAESLLGSEASDTATVACAADQCVDEVARFEEAFAADALADEATLETVVWVGEQGNPHTEIEVTAPDSTMTDESLADFRGRILDVADSVALSDIGDVRTVIHYRHRVEFAFQADGSGVLSG